MNEKKETQGGIVGMLAIACVIAAMLMPPSKAKSGSSLKDEEKVPAWKIQIEKKKPELALEKDQNFFSQDSLVNKVIKRVRDERPLFEKSILQFQWKW
jgi:lipoprotein